MKQSILCSCIEVLTINELETIVYSDQNYGGCVDYVKFTFGKGAIS